jgi:hypothetical protein
LGFLIRLYVDALMKGNPLAVLVTVVGAVALSVGPFYEGLSKRDPAAIGIAGFIAFGIVALLALAIVDRKLNPPEGKARKKGRPRRR